MLKSTLAAILAAAGAASRKGVPGRASSHSPAPVGDPDLKLSLAAEVGGVGLFELGAGGRSLVWDARMHALHGTQPAAFAPTLSGWRRMVHPADVDRLTEDALAALRADGPVPLSWRIVRPDGTVRHARALVRRAPGDRPRLIGAVVDVTGEREAEARLRQANDHIGQFAAIASHDLQAPLRQIVLWTDVLREDAGDRLEPDMLAVLDRIEGRARKLRTMIAGLIEFSTAGAEVALEPVDLTRLATEAVADQAAALAAAQASAVVEPLPPALGAPVLVGRIFDNLVSNAVKYRGDRPLQLVISGHAEPGMVVVTVRDNGIGIAPGYADTVFELFRRLPSAAGQEGSGIGLAVCRRMAEAMGGDISLDTAAADGTMFVLRLRPVPDVPGGAGAARGTPPTPP